MCRIMQPLMSDCRCSLTSDIDFARQPSHHVTLFFWTKVIHRANTSIRNLLERYGVLTNALWTNASCWSRCFHFSLIVELAWTKSLTEQFDASYPFSKSKRLSKTNHGSEVWTKSLHQASGSSRVDRLWTWENHFQGKIPYSEELVSEWLGRYGCVTLHLQVSDRGNF